jgi:beta-galactosidase
LAVVLPILIAFLLSAFSLAAQVKEPRTTVSLDGTWKIADSVSADAEPAVYDHSVPVPGLAHSATPPFKNVDEFQSRQLLSNLVDQGMYSKADFDRLGNSKGISHQKRNYFWYRRTFIAPPRRAVALLTVNKAQFGIVVFLNGIKLGEHYPCFTSATFDATHAIHWGKENTVVIRVGAHPGVLLANVSEGTDFEKNRWTPGIYDDISLMVMDNPILTNVQVAPNIHTSQILVQTELHNYSNQPIRTEVQQSITTWKGSATVATSRPLSVTLAGGETRLVQQTIPVPHEHLWSPEDPFLYKVESRTSGDSLSTRFGMREFRFDTVTQRAYLNGKPFFMRGSNICLHRFFEDPDSGTLPWNDAWLHKLLVTIPKQMHWNSFRFCIGPVPDRWLQIADESGLLIENEYMVWVDGYGLKNENYNVPELTREYRDWMRDNWNHPSVVIWDANNESNAPEFDSEIIPAVRGLDLSHRPWENSYNAPQGADDPVEDHSYPFFSTATSGIWKFHMTDLESLSGMVPNPYNFKTAHAQIINEYGWLWLNRDGSPTLLTDKLYPMLLGPNSTANQRFAMQAYLLAGETEFWRAYRRYAGVLHFVYLTASDPHGFTSDNFQDVKTLTLEPHFADYMRQAFQPLGVYIAFWHPQLDTGGTRKITVMMVNDTSAEKHGTLQLKFVDSGEATASLTQVPFHLQALGAEGYLMTVHAPNQTGKYTLEAVAITSDNAADPTLSRRWVTIASASTKH